MAAWLDDLNDSELALLAQDQDPEAHRDLDRNDLVAIATGAAEEPLPQRAISKVRLRIMEYVLEHWTQVKPLLSCPARTGDPRACFQCTDVQSVECALTNKDTIFGKEGSV